MTGAYAEVVVITGASAGVGCATALEFARRGARIALLARDRAALEQVARQVLGAGGTPLVLVVDVADSTQVEQAAQRVEQQWGRIDIWVNNAMASVFAPLSDIEPEEFQRATDVTYLGCVWGTMAALKRMRARNAGTIVQVGSALAYRSIPLQAPYCGAKHAIRGFTDSVRSELLHDGSRVHLCMVQMPALNTPQFDWSRNKLPRQPRPVPPVFQPEVAARAIVWAAHHRRRELIVGTSSLRAIWANRWIPGLLDRYLARAGYTGQQSPLPATERADNLWRPVSGHRCHGRFDGSAHRHALRWPSRRGWTIAGGIALGACLWWYRKRAQRTEFPP